MKSESRRQFETVFLLATLVALAGVGVATYLIDARGRQDRERIELLSDIVQHTGTAVCVVDADTREIIHWNMAGSSEFTLLPTQVCLAREVCSIF